jgi:hypothetical protein
VCTLYFEYTSGLITCSAASGTDRDALAEFERARDDLSILMQNVGSLVDWWDEMNTSLTSVEGILPEAKGDGKHTLRTGAVRERWIRVYEDYLSYQKQVRHRHYIYRCLLIIPSFVDEGGRDLLR